MAAEDICAMLLRSQSPFPDALSGSPRQKTVATTAMAAAAMVAEEIAIAAIVFFLVESPALYFTSRTHSRRTIMNYERYL